MVDELTGSHSVYQMMAADIGGGCNLIDKMSGKQNVSLTLAHPMTEPQ